MFSSLLRAPRRCQGLVFKRTLANVLSENTALQVYDPNATAATNKPTDEPTPTPTTTQKIETSKTHGLYAFFRRKQGEDLFGEDKYDVLGGLYEEDVVNRSGASSSPDLLTMLTQSGRTRVESLGAPVEEFHRSSHAVVCSTPRAEPPCYPGRRGQTRRYCSPHDSARYGAQEAGGMQICFDSLAQLLTPCSVSPEYGSYQGRDERASTSLPRCCATC